MAKRGVIRYAMALPRRLVRGSLTFAAMIWPTIAPAQPGGAASCAEPAVPCCRVAAPATGVAPTTPAFGVQIWPTGLTSPAAIERLVALKPQHLRFALGPNWRREPALEADMSDARLDAFVAEGFRKRFETRELETVRALQRQTGARLHLVVWDPPWLPGEREAAGAGRVLRREQVPLAARFLVALLKYVVAQGITPDAVELVNEPDGDWNIAVAPADYVALVEAVRIDAARRNLSLPRIFGPATSTVAALRRYLRDADIAGRLLDAIDVLSVHAWDNPDRRARFSELFALQDDLRRLGRAPELAVTEYGLARPDTGDASDRANVKKRAPDTVANTERYASLTARDVLHLFAAGAGTVIYWEFQDQDWGRSSFGLLNESGDERPIYRIMRQLSQRIAEDKPERFRFVESEGLFVARSAHFESLWVVNTATESKDIVISDGVRLAHNRNVRTCGGKHAPVLTVPPWSFLGTAIVRP
jgi:hypothetical protein